MFYKDKSELITNSVIDKITNTDIGDILGFMETILTLEQVDIITFTKHLDRDTDLADLFRLCLKDFLTENPPKYFSEFMEDWLTAKQKSLDIPEEVVECCPNCGEEISMMMDKDAKVIKFCPYCGQKDVLLCSRCMEINEGCHPKGYGAFCRILGIDHSKVD